MKDRINCENRSIELVVHLHGGAIIDFHLKENKFNPLSFEFSQDQMPENNKGGAPFRGHFICLGRWGEPSQGEKCRGIPNHGEFANIKWKNEKVPGLTGIKMSALSPLEGLKLERKISMDKQMPVFRVKETVTNVQQLGRVYNWVQHPTLSGPFLDQDTIIDCNGDLGFNQYYCHSPEEKTFKWSSVNLMEEIMADSRTRGSQKDSLFTFKVHERDTLGWISAYFPTKGILIGYLWRREDYPWIHHWLHYDDSKLKYRGIEFGTAGIHRPFKEIVCNFPKVFGLLAFDYLDAGESKDKEYISFIMHKGSDFQGIEMLDFQNGVLVIHERKTGNQSRTVTDFKQFI